MAKNRRNQPKPLSQQIHQEALARRIEFLEGAIRLIVPDLRTLGDAQNFQGNVLQAAVNVLGPGPVGEEMKRLQKEAQGQEVGQAPETVAEQAVQGELALAPVDANGSEVVSGG